MMNIDYMCVILINYMFLFIKVQLASLRICVQLNAFLDLNHCLRTQIQKYQYLRYLYLENVLIKTIKVYQFQKINLTFISCIFFQVPRKCEHSSTDPYVCYKG